MQSFSFLDGPPPPPAPPRRRRRVLVTGAAGNIGSGLPRFAHRRYDLRLMVRTGEDPARVRRFGKVVTGDLADLDALKVICRGIDTIVHLAANPSPAAVWDDLLRDNIIGTYNLFAAATAAGCRRVIFASSIHAVSGYPPDFQARPGDPVNPGDVYGVSKCFGEAMGRYAAEQEGVSTIVLRIGACTPLAVARSPEAKLLDSLVTDRDLHRLIAACIDDTRLRFAIFHAISDNRVKRLDITSARMLVGYEPRDDSGQLHPAIRALGPRETISWMSTRGGQASGMRGHTRKARR